MFLRVALDTSSNATRCHTGHSESQANDYFRQACEHHKVINSDPPEVILTQEFLRDNNLGDPVPDVAPVETEPGEPGGTLPVSTTPSIITDHNARRYCNYAHMHMHEEQPNSDAHHRLLHDFGWTAEPL